MIAGNVGETFVCVHMTSSNFFLSIGIPTWNRYPFLKKNVKQIINEIVSTNNTQVEIFISDNASEDETQNYCEALLKKYSFFHYYRHEKNQGANANFQNVIQISKGKYIWLLGDDDMIVPGSIEKIIAAIKSYKYPDIIIGACLNNQTNEKIYPPFISTSFLTDQTIIKKFDAIAIAGKISVLIFKKVSIDSILPISWQAISFLTTPWPHIIWVLLILNSGGNILFFAEATNYFLEENRYNILQDGVVGANIRIRDYARLILYLKDQKLINHYFYDLLKKSITHNRSGEFLKIVAYATYMNGYWQTLFQAIKIFKDLPGCYVRLYFLIFFGLPICLPITLRKIFLQLPKILFPKWLKYKKFIEHVKQANKHFKKKQKYAREIFNENDL